MNIGMTGGSTLVRLGAVEEVVDFFDRVREVTSLSSEGADLIVDRLYRRYLRSSDIQPAAELIPPLLALLASSANPEQRSFQRRFADAFEKCAESASLNFEAFRETDGYVYEPVRLVIADLPWFAAEKSRPLGEYDRLRGSPFWRVG